ncbi:hypothetical protein KGF57_003856 [Candida theae]|uniref:Uncharacterized protein n=1 Tax=Candida theae TaxID=1198502 RepID=A0AAD5BCF2_9ASCO|nr:uncharacterized protein KGF57_003856 [Candida theae]KAI5954832.1 hypothetical protein KGF57_003856 [Candida theae]
MSTSSIDHTDHEKAAQVNVAVTYERSTVEDEEYDYDDPKNYSTNYVDEYNPRGLRVPTKSEEETLRRVIGKINYAIFLICVVEFAERASYYSVTGILANFIQRPLPENSPHGWGAPQSDDGSESAGALNRGLQAANALTNLISLLVSVVPLLGGYLADTKWGRWKTIQWGVVFGGIAHILFIISAAPSVIANGKAGLALCILAIFTLAFGSGFISPNLLPLLLDQYPESGNRVKVLKSGEKVIVDREKTLESVTMIFYWAINIGAFFQLATSYCERRIGFWFAFFIPLILYLVMPLAFWFVKPKLVFEKPSGSVIGKVLKILVVTFSGNFVKRVFDGTFWEYAKPSAMRARGREYFNTKKQTPINWTDQHVLDVKQTFDACKLFFYYIFFNLADNGLGSVETSLAGAMNLNGVPNDLFNNFNPLAIIVVIPVLDFLIYPLLRRLRVNFRPIYRVFTGFVIVSLSQVVGAVLQHRVYQTSPCGNHSTNCSKTSPISAWSASAVYILTGTSECFAMTTIYTLTYNRAAPAMKGFTYALNSFTGAISSAISLAVTPALTDPYLVLVFAVIAGVSFLAGAIVLVQFFNLHKTMAEEEKERMALGGSVVSEKSDENNELEAVRPGLSSRESLSSSVIHDGLRSHSRKGASHLPSLPNSPSVQSDKDFFDKDANLSNQDDAEGNSYVEFDLSSMNTRNRTSESLSKVSEKVYTPSNPNTPQIEEHPENPFNTTRPKLHPESQEDDFFSESNWKEMKTISDMDFYNDKGELQYKSESGHDFIHNNNVHFGYTKIDTEEQVNKYAALDKKTDFLFKNATHKPRTYGEKNVLFDAEDDEEFDNDDEVDPNEALTDTKDMLSDSQRLAYVGMAKLITVDMATKLVMVQFGTSSKLAKQMSESQKHFSNWSSSTSLKLYDHLGLIKEEKEMIENLSKHGVEVNDLVKSITSLELNKPEALRDSFDLRWVLVCDLFLLLLSDGYYDARSRSLLMTFADIMGISSLEILQFERRLMECLDMETKEKSIENKDELLNDQSFVKQQIKKNKNKRLVMIGLATLGGSLAIGLSAGLLAPVIGAGIAAGLTTVGITGTSGFLAGVGGSVLITTSGVAIGAQVGNKAGSRRVGDVQTFELKPLHNNKRPNLIVTVSGWMNGAMDDVRLPFSTVDPVMGDMFSLLWEPEMLQSMGQTIGILASEALSTSIQQILGATILSALMSAIQLPMALSKLSYLLDNPWNVSLDRAWKAGKILAETILSGNLGVRPITLVGFSLGARLIYSCLIEMAQRGGYGLIENVILLGAPIAIDVDHLAQARSVVSGKFINGYSKKDWILGYLFRATGGGISTVAGLSALETVSGIENIDCTEFVEGHMSYRKAIPKILKSINWEVLSDDFAEIEEPDPEQGERQRQLISEFDEARAKMEEQKSTQTEPRGWKKWFKPKKKDWWDIYGQPGADKDKKDRTSEEYNVEEPPVFDIEALAHEVSDIEAAAAVATEAEGAKSK